MRQKLYLTSLIVKPFYANVPFLNSLKKSENLWLSDIFRMYRSIDLKWLSEEKRAGGTAFVLNSRSSYRRFFMKKATAGNSASYNPRLRCQRFAGLQGLIMRQKKFEFVFLSETCWSFQYILIFHLWKKAMSLVNSFSLVILWKIYIKKI